jgi:hypothetical protein
MGESFSYKLISAMSTENIFCEYSHASSGCGILFVTLREEYRLRVFQNRVPMNIFGHKRDEVTGVEKTTE